MKVLVALTASVLLLSAAQAQTIEKRMPRQGEEVLRYSPKGLDAQASAYQNQQDRLHVKPDGTLYQPHDPTPEYMRVYHGAPYGE